MTPCQRHPFGSDTGADCTLDTGHAGGCVYVSAWLADALHGDGVADQ